MKPSRTFEHKCVDGKQQIVSDYSFTIQFGEEKVTHLYCNTCKSHLFRGKTYNEAEWEEYINATGS